MPTAPDMRHARHLWDYLRLGVPVCPAECLMAFGGHDLGVAGRAAELYADGIAPFIVVSGGSRAVPDGSDFATKADAIADVLLRRDIPKDAIALERLASNTSENFWLSAELLRDLGMDRKPSSSCTSPTPNGVPWPPQGAAGQPGKSRSPLSRSASTTTAPATSPRPGSCRCWLVRPSAWSPTRQPA